MHIEKAQASDSAVLTEITKASKAYWGYSREQLDEWAEALTITEDYVERHAVYQLVLEAGVVGYYSFFYEAEDRVKLDNLFVLPAFIGKGLGRVLLTDFLGRVGKMGATTVVLDSEPHAEKFYARFGFVPVGRVATSIPGRYLPVMELGLASD